MLMLFIFAKSVGANESFPTLAPETWVTKTVEPERVKTPKPTFTITPEPYPAPEIESWFDDLFEKIRVLWR